MISQSTFGKMPDGTAVKQFCLSNHQGVSVEILSLGGVIVCFETQFYPDTPNQRHFPSATLEAGKELYSVTEYEVLF